MIRFYLGLFVVGLSAAFFVYLLPPGLWPRLLVLAVWPAGILIGDDAPDNSPLLVVIALLANGFLYVVIGVLIRAYLRNTK
jgi:uncharacterized RDD family membrane protein YckC